VSRAWWSLLLLLAACRGEDAYLGGNQQAYECSSLRCSIEQGAPADAGDWFWNPEAEQGDAPEVVYPLTGSVHPFDLRQLTVQFRRGRGDFELFRLRIEAPGRVSYDFFLRCLAVGDDGCRFLLQGALWQSARSELLGKAATMTVTGSTGRQGVQKTSKALPFRVVESDLGNKGFYYWSTVPQYSQEALPPTGIFRLPFGADQAEPFIMPGTTTNDRQCGACHSVSSDGSTIAFTARNDDDSVDQRSGSLVVKLTTQPAGRLFEPASTYDSSMMALTSTGKRVLVAYDRQLVLRSSENNPFSAYKAGDVITTLTADDLGGKAGYFPEFSPDDDAVVVTLSDEQDSAIAVRAGDIAVLDFDAFNSKFSKPKTVAEGTDELFNFYPTWSPDGRYIAFASAPRELDENGNPRKSYDQKKARLRLVSREGGTVYELENATHQRNKWSTYPKFAPFSVGHSESRYFLTFNSKINYGLLLDNDAKERDEYRVAQLWMSEVDATKLPADPSSAPLWLPFQDPTQPGHLGLWTKEVKCRKDQAGPACDFGQICNEANTCVVIPK
jgi:hypothetical protein